MAARYAELLKHPLWQRRRLERLNAAGWKCSKCGDADSTLHVHHTVYRPGAAPWEYNDDELPVLCETCHGLEHGKRIVLPSRRQRAATPMRQPADRLAWMLLLESGWWAALSNADHAALCALPGWHGELFRFLDRQSTERGAQPWAALRERIRDESWGHKSWGASALALVDAEEPGIEPLAEDLPRCLAMVLHGPALADAYRVLGRI